MILSAIQPETQTSHKEQIKDLKAAHPRWVTPDPEAASAPLICVDAAAFPNNPLADTQK